MMFVSASVRLSGGYVDESTRPIFATAADVDGMSCMSPTAPAEDSACSSQLDSHLMTAQIRYLSTPYRWEARSITSACSTG